LSKVEVNEIDKQSGSTLTLGGSGTTVQLGTGASQTGFGRTGSVNWQTTPKTATFTAADGEGYFINSGSSITANLPAGSAGAIVAFSDYARNFATHNFVISPNGSDKIGGIAQNLTLSVDGQALTLVYVDSTKGWINVQNAEDTETGIPPFIGATGGTITTSGNCTIHTFTGPGTFTVSRLATCAANNQVSYMVVAGGGGSGSVTGGYGTGGGGAGGFREDKSPVTPYTASPRDGAGNITVTATSFPITVGAGGAAGATPAPNLGGVGGTSTFSTITSAGGGNTQANGGSGGGGGPGASSGVGSGGTGNSPPVSPAQGTNGGPGGHSSGGVGAGGGGGATVGGGTGVTGPSAAAGDGGAGATTEINGSSTAFAGGGGGGTNHCAPIPSGKRGVGGAGGGGNGQSNCAAGENGTDNTGGGAGGADSPNGAGNTGGSGIVIIRYKSQ
jgi:hypothetical protein